MAYITLVPQYVEKSAQSFPDKTAISFGDESISYQELNKKANQFARYFINNGLGSGDYICIKAKKSITYLIAVLGILKSGAAYIPVGEDVSLSSLQAILDNAKPVALLVDDSKSLSPCFDSVSCIELKHLDIESSSFHSEDIAPTYSDDDTAYVIYTSGTTGLPKGVMVSHANLSHTYQSWESVYELSPSDVHLQMAPVAFDVFTGDWVRALCSGGTLVLCDKSILIDAERLNQLMIESKITCAEFVPAVLRNLCSFLEKKKGSFDLRLLVCGSDVWTMSEYRRVKKRCQKNTRLINSYGLTEATIDSSWYEEQEQILDATQNVPVGRPFPHVDFFVMNHEGTPVKAGEVGELCIGGKGVAQGYLGQPDLTKERFISHPLHHDKRLYKTGDSGRVLHDGTIEFLGRNQAVIKINGNRVELLALESVITQFEKVSACIAYPEINEKGQVHIECLLIAEDKSLTYEDILSVIKKALPGYYLPKKLFLIGELALTSNGKVNRNPASQKIVGELCRHIEPVIDEIECEIYQIWKDVLNEDAFGRNANFFELGGSSIQYMEFLSRLNDTFGLSVSYCDTGPVISDIANYIKEQSHSPACSSFSR